jgi:predicted Zn-dependent protease
MPGGKIVFYTGILPVTQNEAGIAVVMGHEIAHALLNHGQQRMSAGLLQQLGAIGLSIGLGATGLSPETQGMFMAVYGIGSELGGTLPFSRHHENEADYLGLILMTIAGYNPEEAVFFWERMNALGGGASVPQFLSTHPSSDTRVRQLRGWVPEARRIANDIGIMQ